MDVASITAEYLGAKVILNPFLLKYRDNFQVFPDIFINAPKPHRR